MGFLYTYIDSYIAQSIVVYSFAAFHVLVVQYATTNNTCDVDLYMHLQSQSIMYIYMQFTTLDLFSLFDDLMDLI